MRFEMCAEGPFCWCVLARVVSRVRKNHRQRTDPAKYSISLTHLGPTLQRRSKREKNKTHKHIHEKNGNFIDDDLMTMMMPLMMTMMMIQITCVHLCDKHKKRAGSSLNSLNDGVAGSGGGRGGADGGHRTADHRLSRKQLIIRKDAYVVVHADQHCDTPKAHNNKKHDTIGLDQIDAR